MKHAACELASARAHLKTFLYCPTTRQQSLDGTVGSKDRFGLIGNTIAGTFRVDEVVAEGGFGVVYRAFHLHFRAPVALKCLKIPGELSQEERQHFLEQFRSEAEIQFRLSAALPNIVRPLHVDAVQSADGEFVPLMALEWLEGQSFEKIIEQRTFSGEPPMALDEVIALIGPVAQALHEAHDFKACGESLSVVHRDIKPDNLFVTVIGGKKIVKLLDFGISKIRRTASQLAGHFSQTDGQAPFSPAYGAPEQWVPKRLGQTGPWTDVWGLALTLVEIIKGDAVIIGDHQAMMGTVLDPDIRPTPRAEGVIVSDEVESVFQKALSLDPRYRYQSIQTFWEALLAAVVLGGESTTRFDETPSGRKIPLPRMSAPTPWTPPNRALFEVAAPIGALPAMLAPAGLAKTDAAELAMESAYPTDPESDLHPVPAAPTSWEHFDPEIPPMSANFDDVADSPHAVPPLDPDEILPVTSGRPEAEADSLTPRSSATSGANRNSPHARYFTEHQVKREPSLKLELACTSNFPNPPSSPLWAPPTDDRVPPVQDRVSTEHRVPPPRPSARGSHVLPEVPDLFASPTPTTSQPARGQSNQGRPPAPSRGAQRPPPPSRAAQPAQTAQPSSAAPPSPPRRNPVAPPRPSVRQENENDGPGDDDGNRPLSLVPARRRRSTAS